MNVIIAGGRTFNDYSLLKAKCDEIIAKNNTNNSEISIITGGAKGADSLGAEYASERNYSHHVFEANWDLYGKSAGMLRNIEMVNFTASTSTENLLIAFWDEKSSGTRHMIGYAGIFPNIKIYVIRYKRSY